MRKKSITYKYCIINFKLFLTMTQVFQKYLSNCTNLKHEQMSEKSGNKNKEIKSNKFILHRHPRKAHI